MLLCSNLTKNLHISITISPCFTKLNIWISEKRMFLLVLRFELIVNKHTLRCNFCYFDLVLVTYLTVTSWTRILYSLYFPFLFLMPLYCLIFYLASCLFEMFMYTNFKCVFNIKNLIFQFACGYESITLICFCLSWSLVSVSLCWMIWLVRYNHYYKYLFFSFRWFEWDIPEKKGSNKLNLKSSAKKLVQLEDVGQQLALVFNFDGSILATGAEVDKFLYVYLFILVNSSC